MNIFKKIKALYYKENLTMLAKLYKTDKTGSHYYTPHYQLHFQEFRTKPIHLLEIGIGGYENPKAGGESLRMWKRFFPKGNIYGIDIYDKKDFEEERIKIFQGSQIDKPFLNQLVLNIPALDIIIDDGSHINEHVIESFRILFPFLKNGGIYVIEDTQTSYWQNYGGDSNNLNNSKTLMCFFKSLIDGLNYKEFIQPNGYQPSYYDLHIVSMHFYHNLIFIYKGDNIEESNMIRNNQSNEFVDSYKNE